MTDIINENIHILIKQYMCYSNLCKKKHGSNSLNIVNDKYKSFVVYKNLSRNSLANELEFYQNYTHQSHILNGDKYDIIFFNLNIEKDIITKLRNKYKILIIDVDDNKFWKLRDEIFDVINNDNIFSNIYSNIYNMFLLDNSSSNNIQQNTFDVGMQQTFHDIKPTIVIQQPSYEIEINEEQTNINIKETTEIQQPSYELEINEELTCNEEENKPLNELDINEEQTNNELSMAIEYDKHIEIPHDDKYNTDQDEYVIIDKKEELYKENHKKHKRWF